MDKLTHLLRVEFLPAVVGAYLLAIDLPAALPVRFGRRRRAVLLAGRYVYCGSAYGPGGLRARVGRHLRRDKPIRWHVDRLTAAGRIVEVLAVPDGDECDLFAAVSGCPGAAVPLPGFGSSDCRRCPAHLLRVPLTFSPGNGIAGQAYTAVEVVPPSHREGNIAAS